MNFRLDVYRSKEWVTVTRAQNVLIPTVYYLKTWYGTPARIFDGDTVVSEFEIEKIRA